MYLSQALQDVMKVMRENDDPYNLGPAEFVRIFKARIKNNEALAEEIMYIGLRAALREAAATPQEKENRQETYRNRQANRKQIQKMNEDYAKKHRIPVDDVVTHQLKTTLGDLSVKIEKAAKFDRFVALLDTWKVNGLMLGDCTKADLRRAALEDKSTARDLIRNSVVYERLAAVLSSGETLRESNARVTILEIIAEAVEAGEHV